MSRGRTAWGFQKLFALTTLLLLFVVFSLFGKRFFSQDMMLTIVESSYSILTMALGLTFIIITGGIDLSLGAVAMCGAILAGVASTKWGLPLWAGLIIRLSERLFNCVLQAAALHCDAGYTDAGNGGRVYYIRGTDHTLSHNNLCGGLV